MTHRLSGIGELPADVFDVGRVDRFSSAAARFQRSKACDKLLVADLLYCLIPAVPRNTSLYSGLVPR